LFLFALFDILKCNQTFKIIIDHFFILNINFNKNLSLINIYLNSKLILSFSNQIHLLLFIHIFKKLIVIFLIVYFIRNYIFDFNH
jgi:hypothetical protein